MVKFDIMVNIKKVEVTSYLFYNPWEPFIPCFGLVQMQTHPILRRAIVT